MSYYGEVFADSPTAFWRLDASSFIAGSVVVDYAGLNNAIVHGGVTAGGASSPVLDDTDAPTFDGSTGYIELPVGSPVALSGTWSVEFWANVLSNTPGGSTSWGAVVRRGMGDLTFDGKIYGVPNSGVQPVLFYYNKDIFSKLHLNPPQTWNELLQAVTKLKQQNIIPIALAGGSKWPYLMYEEYLVDRYGGPDAFNAVLANQGNSWSGCFY